MSKAAAVARPHRAEIRVEIVGLALLALVVFTGISVYSEQLVATGHTVSNLCGPVGHLLSSTFIGFVGIIGVYGFLLALTGGGVCVFFRVPVVHWRLKLAALLFLVLPAACVTEWYFTSEPLLGTGYAARGGYLGEFLGSLMVRSLDRWGTLIVLGLTLTVGFLLATDLLLSPFVRLLLRGSGRAVVQAGRGAPTVLDWVRRIPWPKLGGDRKGSARARKSAARNVAAAVAIPAKKPAPQLEAEAEDAEEDEYVYEDEEPDEGEYAEDQEEEEEEEDEDDEEYEDEDEDDEEEEEDEEDEEDDDNEEASAGEPVRTIQVSHRSEEQDLDLDLERRETQLSLAGVYNLPPLSLLDDPPPPVPGAGRDELEEVALKIERTLASFKIEARVENVMRGPVITQYEVSLAAGIKVHRIVSLSDDLAMALSARSVRVVAPIPGKSAVGIEVPNRVRETVTLKELLMSRSFQEQDLAIPLAIGKDVAGTPLIEDLTRMPHLLIAGATGSGKSVCINSLISCILMTRSPDELKLILVDPKMVELSVFEEVPHLLTPVITDMKKAPAALEWLCRKMDERYHMLSRAEVRNIQAYNELGKQELYTRLTRKMSHEEAEATPVKLPYIVIVIDELADLMMSASKEVENSIIRLSQKSRAVGIHVLLATQRPSVDVITGLIKANLPCRISFQVAGRVDSRTVIDGNGAEKLLGQGDMLFLPPGRSQVMRAQATFISDKEIRRIVKFLKQEKQPEFNTEIQTYLESDDGGKGGLVDDELFDDAVRIVLESGRGSTSLLQRRLGIGYTRASRLMDLMTDQGIVGPFKGSKAREVFMTLEDWEARQSEAVGE